MTADEWLDNVDRQKRISNLEAERARLLAALAVAQRDLSVIANNACPISTARYAEEALARIQAELGKA